MRDALAPLLGTRDGSGEFIFPLPASARIDTLLLGCTHYPLLRPLIQAIGGEAVAIVDSATATASALAELLSVNGLEAPGTTRGTAADAGRAGHERPDETHAQPTHVQLTTGDVAQFRALAGQTVRERVRRRRADRAPSSGVVTRALRSQRSGEPS